MIKISKWKNKGLTYIFFTPFISYSEFIDDDYRKPVKGIFFGWLNHIWYIDLIEL